ncbi:MAG: serine/threonine-protein kinase [Polyangiaceae bacterium]
MSSKARVDEGAGEARGPDAIAPGDAVAPSSGGAGRGPTSRAEGPVPSSGGMPRIPTYELLEEIGHGGMATVYRALDPRLGREVAVKVIHKHLRENTEVATRFVAEARAAAKLRHPNIVEVFDVSNEEDSERYLVVELLRGTTLRKLLIAHRDMPAEVGAAISLEICDALEHAHEATSSTATSSRRTCSSSCPATACSPGAAPPRACRAAAGDEEAGVALADFDEDHASGPRRTPSRPATPPPPPPAPASAMTPGWS